MRNKIERSQRPHSFSLNTIPYALLIMLCLMLANDSQAAQAGPDQLWLSLAPSPQAVGVPCEIHGGGQPSSENKSQAKSQGQGQRPPRKPSRFESEHRPTAIRTYYINGAPLSKQAKAYLLHADGNSEEVPIVFGSQPKIEVNTPLKDDGMHGGNNIYVVDQEVQNGVLMVRVAKWLTVHHSCSWGHDYRSDPSRLEALTLEEVPLDTAISGLWNGNFHVETHSGDLLKATTMHNGVPQPGVTVTINTEKKWSHTTVSGPNGVAEIQLIRDYYPKSWTGFKRSQMGQFTVTADYLVAETGEYLDKPYQQIRYISTFPWKYTPSSQDYNSYGYGLGMASAAMLLSAFGVYTYRDRRRKSYKRIDLDG